MDDVLSAPATVYPTLASATAAAILTRPLARGRRAATSPGSARTVDASWLLGRAGLALVGLLVAWFAMLGVLAPLGGVRLEVALAIVGGATVVAGLVRRARARRSARPERRRSPYPVITIEPVGDAD